MKLVSGSLRVARKRIPAEGVLTNGAAVTAFEIAEDMNGDAIPKGMKIKRMVTAHVNASDVAVASISEATLYGTYAKAAKDMVYQDAWSDFTEAASYKFDGTEVPYINLDDQGVMQGTARVKSGATDAALYLTVYFEAL